MTQSSPRFRLSILGIVALCLFGALFARLWYLQVMAAPGFQVRAEATSKRTVAEEAPRGRILDAQGRVLVGNRTSLVVTVDPQVFPGSTGSTRQAHDDLVLELASTLTSFGAPTKVSHIERRMVDGQFDPLQPRPVAIDVPAEVELYLAERADEFPGVAVERQTLRTYPNGQLASHLLGYVGRINDTEFTQLQTDAPENPKPYQLSSSVGKGGVERAFEAELRGTPGRRVIEVDSNNRPVRTLEHVPPQPGNDIQITVDIDAQAMAETALAEQLERVRGNRTRDRLHTIAAPAGSVVVIDPNTGGVVAMASYPTFDPEEFVNGISQDRYDQLTKGAESENPLVNRAIQGLYAPGSTFKPFTAIAAMQAGMITAADSKNDDGVYERPGDAQVWRNAGSKANGMVNVRSSLTVSSDWYYYWLGDRFWLESDTYGDLAQQEGYERFGFGAPTGVTLPGEASGRVPTPDWKRAFWESFPEDERQFGDPNWLPGDNMNMAIGQGNMLVSPLQLANAYATLANGGNVMQPELLKAVLVPGGDPANPADVIRVAQPEVIAHVDLPPEMLDPVREGLRGAVASSGGTAYGTFQGFDLVAFPIAGKTGTAEVDNKAESSIFASFAPIDAPRYAVVALLEEAGFGADAAAPVVRRVYEVLANQNHSAAADIVQAGTE